MLHREMLSVCAEGIRRQNAECKTNGELGSFWNAVQYLISDGELIEGGDFAIRYCSMFKTEAVNVTWISERPILFLQKTRIFNLYRKEGRQANEKVLPTDALKYYLQNSPAYLGNKVMRFDVYKKGILQYHPAEFGKQPQKKSVVQRCYCFDYQKLQEMFGINFGSSEPEEDNTPF